MKKQLLFILISTMWSISMLSQTVGGVPKAERDALMALYNATDGSNWWQNTNWNTEIDVAQWYGVTVENGYVTVLNLDWNQLTGTIPAEIGGLTNLRVLSLYGNQLTGSIPTEIGQMINLESLDLDNNQLSGNIPSELGNLTKLYSLDLRNNQLTGSIPSQLNELTHLQYINLSNNQLSSIEGELSNLTNVYSLNLAGNKLTFADLETANVNISSYSPQDFIYNNQVEDGDNIILTAPESAGGESFQWYKNNVKVDEETNQQITVAKTEADAYFCKVTHSNFPDLTLHSINANQIIGGVFKFDRDALLALYNATDGPNWNQNRNWNTENDVAQWYGVTVESGYVTELYLGWNQLSGTIPAEIGGLTNLRVLSLYDNQLSGNIPSELGNLTNLYRLDLRNNQLTGSIPLQINELSHLRYLYLSNNQLSSIEGELSNLTNVYSLNLAGNKLTFADLETANINISSYSPQNFIYNNQVEDGENIILTAPESAGGENFQWYKNNVKVDEETKQQITVAKTEADAYFCKVTHSRFPDLTLKSINSSQIVGGVLKSNREALIALYNATDGSNWNQNRNWNTESDVAQWYGVTVEGGYVTALNLGWNQLTGTIPAEIGGLTNLRVLSLYGNQLTGSIPSELGQMINLTGISLRNNQLTGAIPSELSNLINLESLNLDNNQLSGNIPSELGNLTNLYTLDLRNNQLTGSIPSQLNELSHLDYLDLSNNQLSSIEGELSNLTNVYSLNLEGNKLTFADLETANINISSYSPQNFIYNNQVEDGDNIILTAPESAGGESFQWYKNNVKVDEETNQQITVAKTEADAYFCKVTHSKFPDLTLHSINANQIIGGVFKFDRDALLALYNATDGPNWNQNTNWNTESDVAQWYGVTVENGYVTVLDLGWNQLTGTIPAEIGGLTNLRVLSLYGNQLTDIIPNEVGELINLNYLALNDNQLTGTIPAEIGGLTNLRVLSLYRNQLTGIIPNEVGELINLNDLDLSNNQLTGSIPLQLNELSHLRYLYLSNNQLSSIEGELSNLTNVYSLNLEGNKLTFADLETASINISSYSPQNFIYNNQVEDGDNIILTAPESAGGESFQWYKNNVKVDEETNQQITVAKTEADAYFCKVTHSKFPDLTLHSINANQIIGGVFKFDRDALLALYNATDGPNWNQNTNWNTENDVAQWYGVTVESGYVTALKLDWNQLTGTIPAEIGGLTNLRGLYLNGNQLTDIIPNEVGELINLNYLVLNDNQLSGTIPDEIGGLKNLRGLYLNKNQLTGIIPNEVGELINLNYLDLSNNQLEGAIPSELSELINIWWIILTNNQLSKIEGDLSSLTNIHSFNLAENRLTFTDLEKANIKINSYSPQAMLGITQTEDVNNITLFTSESDGGESYQWYKDGVGIDGSTSRELTIPKTDAGIYHCEITHSKFPDLTLSTEKTSIATGIHSEIRLGLLISPNPFTDQLTIRKATNVVRVEITNLTGKRLFNQKYSGETQIMINSSAFDRGFYLISVYTADGRKTVDKVMKK